MLLLRRLFAILALVFCVNFAVWALVNQSVSEKAFGGTIASLSFSGYKAGDTANRLSDDVLRQRLSRLTGQTRTVRTYGVSDGLDRIAPIAGQAGLNVTLGAWVARDKAANNQEVDRAIAVTEANSNVKRLMIGNEALLREDVSVEELRALLEKARRQVKIPVSTAEPWHIWLKYPELADSVDFISVHILPYWEGIPIDGAMGYLTYRYRQMQTAFPNKHIYIGEVGWPSDGQWVKGAEASQINQAKFIRDFLNAASEQQIDYSIVEAYDEPWKKAIEGSVGAHWGLWDADGHPKFSMSGSIVESTRWLQGCVIASFLAFFPIQWFVRRRPNLRGRGQLFYAGLIQAIASLLVWAVMVAMAERLLSGHMIVWAVMIGAQLMLFTLLLVDGYELAEVIWAKKRERPFEPITNWVPPPDAPKVSIHVPCYNEPPDMVIETLNALAALDYPNFEVLVIDNNTKDEAVWRPLEAHCAKLGARFRFFHLPSWPGFKAGALNFALRETAPDAKIIGVIDSDYVVKPNWLAATIPYFEKEKVSFVQAPQDYRDGQESFYKRLCYWEYAGFFHIGMVQRNERNAIIQHGTMTLIRANVLRGVGGWAEWCICEDAELGLRLFEQGHEAVYLNHSLGQGVMPDSFNSYKTQRFRWAYGAVQIIKQHWRDLSQGKRLTQGQRYHFISGWLPWFADAAHVLFVVAGLVWSVLLMLKWVEFPPAVFLIPTLSVYLFKIVAGLWLYHARVKCSWGDKVGAAVAGMALSHAVARAVWQGIFTSGKPFLRTPKLADKPALMQVLLMAREEGILFLALVTAAISVLTKFTAQNQDALLWTGMLSVQTLPYAAALFLAAANAWPRKPELSQQIQSV